MKKLSTLLLTIALLTQALPALANQPYVPPDRGGPTGTTGSGTR